MVYEEVQGLVTGKESESESEYKASKRRKETRQKSEVVQESEVKKKNQKVKTMYTIFRICAIVFFTSGIICGLILMYDIIQAEHDRRKDKYMKYLEKIQKGGHSK